MKIKKNIDKSDTLFSEFLKKLLASFSEDTVKQLVLLDDKLLKKLGENMARSLIGALDKKTNETQDAQLNYALQSLQDTNLASTIDRIFSYKDSINTLIGSGDDSQINLNSNFASYIVHQALKLNYNSKINIEAVGAPIGFGIGGPVNLHLINNMLKEGDERKYFKDLSFAAAGMVAAMSFKTNPFITKQNQIDTLAVNAIMIRAAKLAADPRFQNLPDDKKTQFINELVDKLCDDKKWKKDYKEGFPSAQRDFDKNASAQKEMNTRFESAAADLLQNMHRPEPVVHQRTSREKSSFELLREEKAKQEAIPGKKKRLTPRGAEDD